MYIFYVTLCIVEQWWPACSLVFYISGHAGCLKRHVSFQYLCECILCELWSWGSSVFRYKWHPSRLEHWCSDESVSVQILPTAKPLHYSVMEHVRIIFLYVCAFSSFFSCRQSIIFTCLHNFLLCQAYLHLKPPRTTHNVIFWCAFSSAIFRKIFWSQLQVMIQVVAMPSGRCGINSGFNVMCFFTCSTRQVVSGEHGSTVLCSHISKVFLPTELSFKNLNFI